MDRVPGASTGGRQRPLSSTFLVTFFFLSGLLELAALLIPAYLRPGWGPVAVGAVAAVDLALAAFLWWRGGFSLSHERALVYVSEINIVIAALTVQDHVGSRLTTSLFILTALFAALFMRTRHVVVVVVTITAATVFVMWHAADSWLLVAVHSATVLVSTVAPCFVVATLRAQLSGALERSLHQAATDPLTGLTNRRGLAQQVPDLVTRARESGYSVGLLSIDIDHFKSVNDTYGHAIGDEVIRDVARLIHSCVRSDDVVVRLGGEEIAVLALLEPSDLLSLAERIRQTVARDCAVTVSVGVASAPADHAAGMDPDAFLLELAEEADTQLYEAKNGGRNRVCARGQLSRPADRRLTAG